MPLVGSLKWVGSAEGAVDVGEYDITPSGISFGGDYAQKYDIQFGSGTLYIVPRILDIAVRKAYDGNATYTTGFTIYNNRVLAGDEVQVTGTATVASADVGLYSRFVENNLVSSNPNYTANPVDTDYYEYTSTGRVLASINDPATPRITQPAPVNDAVTTVVTTQNRGQVAQTASAEPRFISASVEEPTAKVMVASYVVPANDEINFSNNNETLAWVNSLPATGAGRGADEVRLKQSESKSDDLSNLPLDIKKELLNFGLDEGLSRSISFGFGYFFSQESAYKLAKFFGEDAAKSKFRTASKNVSKKFIQELQEFKAGELTLDFVKGILIDTAKEEFKAQYGVVDGGMAEYAIDAFAATIDSAWGSIFDKSMNPIQAKIKFQLDLTIQLGVLTTKQVARTGYAFYQINQQERANALSMADSIIQSASYLQAGKLDQARSQIQTNPIAEGHGLKSQFTYGIDSKFAEALILKRAM